MSDRIQRFLVGTGDFEDRALFGEGATRVLAGPRSASPAIQSSGVTHCEQQLDTRPCVPGALKREPHLVDGSPDARCVCTQRAA